MRVLGIDYGERRVGFAISDSGHILAQRLKTIEYSGKWDILLAKILEVIKEYDVGEIVIGLPRNMDGSIGASGDKAKKFSNFIQERVKANGISVVNWDERLSTVSAVKTISDMGVKKSKRKILVDQVAAMYILQNYLDYKRLHCCDR